MVAKTPRVAVSTFRGHHLTDPPSFGCLDHLLRYSGRAHVSHPAPGLAPVVNPFIGKVFAMIVDRCLGLAALTWLAAVGSQASRAEAQNETAAWAETGTASWYGPGFAGRPTASGETYDPKNLTAAHRTLPLGTLVRVHNLDNDRHMIVRINDRGPFARGRILDMSQAAAEVLGFRDDGITKVRISAVSAPPRGASTAQRAVDSQPLASSVQVVAASVPGEDAAPALASEPTAQQWIIQLGAFRDGKHANEMMQTAGPVGVALQVEYDGILYHVVAGPFESSAAAAQALREIEGNGMKGFVRKRQ